MMQFTMRPAWPSWWLVTAGRSRRSSRSIPAYPSTPELRLDCPEELKFDLVKRAVEHYKRSHEVIDIDGARILFDGGWALIRASNTQPVVVARIEADTPELLDEIRSQVGEYLAAEGVSLPEA